MKLIDQNLSKKMTIKNIDSHLKIYRKQRNMPGAKPFLWVPAIKFPGKLAPPFPGIFLPSLKYYNIKTLSFCEVKTAVDNWFIRI